MKRPTKAQLQAIVNVGRTHPFVSCASCSDGWVHVDHGERDGWRSQTAYRCQCFKAHQALVARLVAEQVTA